MRHKKLMLPRRALLPLLVMVLSAASVAQSVPLQVYGQLPRLEDMALSPDGSQVAFVKTSGNTRVVTVVSLAKDAVLGGVRLGEEKLRSIDWADDHNLMIVTSATGVPWGLIGMPSEWYLLQVYDVTAKKIRQIPSGYQLQGIRMMNVLSGPPMVRQVGGHSVLFVPGVYVADRTLPLLFSVDLTTGHEKLIRMGTASTRGWLVDEKGDVAAQEDYDDQQQHWAVSILRDGRLKEVAGGREAIDIPQLLGFGPFADTLLMRTREQGSWIWRLLSLKDGSLGPPMAERRVLNSPIEDQRSYRMIGGVYIDDSMHYVFFDPVMQGKWDSITRAFPDERVRFVSTAADFTRIVVRVDGPKDGYKFELVDLNSHQAAALGNVYDGVTAPLEIRRITYDAADGLKIPAYLTLPRGRPATMLPLIVLPHGGPAERDTADFDWWPQALAEQGYAVLQPNFRGSTTSQGFLEAGFGQWGRKMQTDLSDGVRYLAAQGTIDPTRVCIVGASYGGYAALAGVTLDHGVYRCAVSVAGPSDLKRMLRWVDEKYGTRSNIAQRHWDRFMGVTGPDDSVLDSISPIKHVDAVTVPVLLIHGKDDTVVPYEQSDVMYDALRRAKKQVDLVTLKHEDHWLSRSETRLQMLQSSVDFLRANNPPE
ncbi:MAG TPA: S9 family peptidase [Steroidobacteraceae bacterium]|nr:S9 family peptidase [Steroidobacteraceae bacterium]